MFDIKKQTTSFQQFEGIVYDQIDKISRDDKHNL